MAYPLVKHRDRYLYFMKLDLGFIQLYWTDINQN